MKAFKLVQKVIHKYNRDDGNILAAALAYNLLLSIFPLVLGLIAIAGFFVPENGARDNFINAVANQFPGSTDFVAGTLHDIVKGRSAAGIIAIVGLLWSATWFFSTLTLALDRIVGSQHPRGLISSTLVALGLVFGVGVLFILSVALSTILRMAFTTPVPLVHLALKNVPLLYTLVGVVLPLLITFLAFAFLYHFVPSVHMPWNTVWPGALLAAVAFEAGKQAFVFYLEIFTNINAVYGSIGAVIVLLSWAFFASILVLIGAEFNVVLNPPSPTQGVRPGSEEAA